MKIKSVNLNLNKEKFLKLRKVATLFSFGVVCLVFLLLFFGAIPFKAHSLSVFSVFDYLLEIVGFGRAPFLYVISNVGIALLYIYTLVRSLIDIIRMVKSKKLWLSSVDDNFDTRTEACVVMYYAIRNVERYLFLFMLSFAISSFSIGVISVLALFLLFASAFAVNAVKYLLIKGEVIESAIVSFNKVLILLSALLLVVLADIQLIDFFNSLLNTVSLFAKSGASFEIKLQLLAENVIKPFVLILSWLLVLRLNRKLTDCDIQNNKFPKRILIINAVSLGVVLVMLGWSHEYTNVGDYLGIVMDNISTVFIVAIVYMASMNAIYKEDDIPYFKDPEPETPIQEPVSESNDDVTSEIPFVETANVQQD